MEGTGHILNGPDERRRAGLPAFFPMDEIVAVGPQVILSEVFYDPRGSDQGREWVELMNVGEQTANLSEFSIGAGGSNYTYTRLQLNGFLPPGEVLVVGGPSGMQNGGSAADGVALFDRRATEITPELIPIDAVVYGTVNSNGLIDETGSPALPHVADAPSDSSIERTDVDGNWRVQRDPSPNSTPIRN